MSKSLINLEVPAISAVYEVKIPDCVTVKELANLLSKTVEDLSDRRYCDSGAEVLYYREQDCLLKEGYMVGDYDIQNGDHLVMM